MTKPPDSRGWGNVALAIIVAAYGASSIVHTSGFMAVYLAAVIIGSTARLPHRRSIIGFADGLLRLSVGIEDVADLEA